jgi:hypothetical protein
LVVVSLPAKHQRSRNDSIQTSLLPNVDVQQDQPPKATAQPSLNEPSMHANEPSDAPTHIAKSIPGIGVLPALQTYQCQACHEAVTIESPVQRS